MARLGRSFPQQPRIRRPATVQGGAGLLAAGATATSAGTKQAQSAPPSPGDYASGAGWASAGFFSPGYPGAPDPLGPQGGTQVQPVGSKNAQGSASIAAGSALLAFTTVSGTSAIPGGTAAAATGAKHATGSVTFAGSLQSAIVATKQATAGAASQAGAATRPPGTKQASGPGAAAAGTAESGHGTHQAQGTSAARAGSAVTSQGRPGTPSSLLAGTFIQATGHKNATSAAKAAASGTAGGQGPKNAQGAGTAGSGAQAQAAGTKQALYAPVGLPGFNAIPGWAVPGRAIPGYPGTPPPLGISAGATITGSGGKNTTGAASVAAGAAALPAGSPGAASSLLAGATVQATGTKSARSGAIVTGTAQSTATGHKNATGTGATLAGGTAGAAGSHQGQGPASAAAGSTATARGAHTATGAASVAAGTTVTPAGRPSTATFLFAGAQIQATGRKAAGGTAGTAASGTASPQGAKNAQGATAARAGAQAEASGTKQALYAPTGLPGFNAVPGWAVPGRAIPGYPGTPPAGGISAGGTLTGSGAKTITASASVAAGSATLPAGSPGAQSAILGGAVIQATGRKTIAGRAALPGSLAAAPAGAKAAQGPSITRAGAGVLAPGTKQAQGAGTAQAGGRQATPGTKTATGISVAQAGALHRPGAPGIGTPSNLAAGAFHVSVGHKSAAGSVAIRAGLATLPLGAKGGQGGARLAAGTSTLGAGTHAAQAAVTLRGGTRALPAAYKATSGSGTISSGGAAFPLGLPVQLVNTWTAAYTAPLAPTTPAPPGAATVEVPGITNTAGNWLFAIVAWRQAAGMPPVTFHIGDGRNVWEPVGAPGGTSPASGTLRVAVWRAAAARAVTTVCAAPTGFVVSAAVAILEMSGLFPWITEAGTVSNFASNVTSLPTLTPPTPPTPVLWLSASVRSLSTPTGSYPGGHWLPGPAAATGNGADHTGDLVLLTAFQQSVTAASATWTQSAASDMAGIVAGVEIFATPPDWPNPSWAPGVFEIAPGAGQGTPADELTWVAVDGTEIDGLTVPARMQDISWTQGQQYTVGSLQAGQGSVTVDNRDLAVTPPGIGAFEGIDSGVPWRYRVTWPGGGNYPVNPAPHYVLQGTTLDLPSTLTNTRRTVTTMGLTDAWAACQPQIQSSLRQEMLADNPSDLWPCGDAAGSQYASNLAPGSTAALAMVTSKYGASGATAAFGGTAALSATQAAVAPGSGGGGLPGDGGTVWAQTGLPAVPTPGGYCLYCQSPDFPALNGSAGWTGECWSALTDTALVQNGTLWAIKGSKGLVLRVWADLTGALWLTTQDIAGMQVTTSLGPTTYANAGLFQTAVTWVAGTGWTAYVNGAQVATSASVPNLAPSYAWVSAGGESDRFTSGGMFDGQTIFLADFPQALSPARIAAHWQAGDRAFQQESDYGRIERLLSYAGYTGRRVIKRAAPADLVASLADLGTTSASAGGSGAGAGTPAGQGTVQAGQEISAVIASLTPAMLSVASTGEVVYAPKGLQFGQPVTWTLGENASAGEIPYQADVALNWDPQRVLNLIQLTQVDRQDVVTPQAFVPLSAGYITPGQSQGKYSQQTFQISAYLYNDLTTPISSANPSNVLDLANWIAVTLAAPHTRFGKVTVDASTYPAAWPLVLGAQPGDIALVGRRPITASAAISLLSRIMRIERQFTWKAGGAKATAVLTLDYCPEASPLTLDDPVLGQIGVPVTAQGGTPAVLTW